MMLTSVAIFAIAGCRQQMADQPHQRPLEPSNFFDDGMASRPVEPGTVARAGKEQNGLRFHSKVDGKLVDTFPFEVTMEVLARGQERYEIFCSPCHDRLGTGQGMIVRRGFTPARSFHDPRLRDAPAGHFFEVITQGFGQMPSYANQLSEQDRWAVIAYIRALQFSRNVRLDQLPPEDRAKMKATQ
ncbi:MAG TPA: cytochrome c [Candidatus Binatia bacterium]|nr:cytochrome c [Candidatus Binatia bacterium]